MVPAPYGYCFKLFDFFRSCKILFGLVKFKTAPDRMSDNVWEVFVNTAVGLTRLLLESPRQYFGSLRLSILSPGKP